jgi:hypothetical protein
MIDNFDEVQSLVNKILEKASLKKHVFCAENMQYDNPCSSGLYKNYKDHISEIGKNIVLTYRTR